MRRQSEEKSAFCWETRPSVISYLSLDYFNKALVDRPMILENWDKPTTDYYPLLDHHPHHCSEHHWACLPFPPRRSHGHSFVFLFLPFLVLLGHNSVTRGLISALIASPGSRVLYNTRDRVPQGLRRAAVCLWHLSSINLYGGWMQPNATCCPHLSGPRRSIKPGERMRTYKSFYTIKGIVHPKMKILSLITHPHVVPNRKTYVDLRNTIKIFHCSLWMVRKLSNFIKNILICVLKMNEGLAGLERREGE